MKEDILVCPFCEHHSHSKLTTNLPDDCVVRCNYCDNAFKMEQARMVPPAYRQPPGTRLLQRARGQTKLSRKAKRDSTQPVRQAEVDADAEAQLADRNDLALAAFVTSLVAFLLAGCLSPISLVFAIVALDKPPRGMAAAAVVLSLVGLIPMVTVALPLFIRTVLDSVDTEITLVSQERVSDEHPTPTQMQNAPSERSNPAPRGSPSQQKSDSASPQEPAAKPPALVFSEIKQQHKPLGGIGIYMTAENTSSHPVSRFEAFVQFVDKNGEVVAQDRVRESFFKPIAPGEKRSLLFSPGIQSELRSIVPPTCRGSAAPLSVN